MAEAEKVDALACGARDSGFDFHPSPHIWAYGVMVAALRLERSGEIRGGSSPSMPTKFFNGPVV